MKSILFLLLISYAMFTGHLFAQTASGTIKYFDIPPSVFVDTRNIDACISDGYDSDKRYSLLYLHAGQMLFDSTKSWKHQDWSVDETPANLLAGNNKKDCIVASVLNRELLHEDYFPNNAHVYLTDEEKTDVYKTAFGNEKLLLLPGLPVPGNYLKFSVPELKPLTNSNFPTIRDTSNTFHAGSDMDGAVSSNAICEYPEVFGGAACLSTEGSGTFKTENNPVPPAFLKYMRDNLPLPGNHKIYFDYGTETLDSNYKPTRQQVDKIMKIVGYTPINWITKEFPGVVHAENAWSTRFYISVNFLLGK